MKKILTYILALSMLCPLFISGNVAANDPFEMKPDAVAFYDEAFGYYKWTVTGTTASELASQFTGSVSILDAEGNAVSEADAIGSDYTVNASGESRKLLIFGDVNRDGRVNVKDVIAMLQYNVGLTSDICTAAYDVNLDGKNNVKDVMRILQMISDWDVDLGYVPWGLDLEKVDAEYEDSTLELYFTDPTAKDAPKESFPNEVYSYCMRLAGNEAEHCNANLYSYTGHAGLNATLSDFTDKFGNTLETTFLWEDYFTITLNNQLTEDVVPDRLPPMEKDFSIESSTGQALFIKVKAGEDSPAGLYRACLEVTDDSGLLIKKAYVYADVWDFNLPLSSSAKTAFGLSSYGIYSHHGISEDPGVELYTKYYEYMLDNRMNPWCMPFNPTDEKADKYMSDPRVNTFLVAGGYSGDIYTGSMDGNYSADYVAEAYEKISKNEEWAKKALFYMDDEPLTAEAVDKVRGHQAFLDQYYPNARTIVPVPINDDYGTADTLGFMAQYSSVMCPCSRLYPGPEIKIDGVINWYTQGIQDKYGKLLDRVDSWRSEGKEIWWYTGGYSPLSPMNNIGPMHSGMENRLMFWQQYAYDVDGYLYWASCDWSGLGSRKVNRLSGNVGLLVYSGKPFKMDEPIACLRAEIVRDGIEDFEYLTLAEKYLGKEAADEYLGRIVTSITEFERDSNILMEVRAQLGEALEAAMAE